MKKPIKPTAPVFAQVDLTDQEIAYIVLALRNDEDANPEVITPLMAKLGCYLAGGMLWVTWSE